MRLRRTITIAALTAAAFLTTHAAATTPKLPNTGTVTSFSIGTAHLKPFRSRPSAKDLYAAALKLYDSFDTIAASYRDSNSTLSGRTLTMSGEVLSEQIDTERSNKEFRYKKPDKLLNVTSENGKVTFVMGFSNGQVFSHSPSHSDHWSHDPYPFPKSPHWPLGFINLIPEKDFAVTEMRLLPDAKVRGTTTYALEQIWVRPASKWKDGSERPPIHQRVLLYLGKTDLLPRKIVISEQLPPKSERKTPGYRHALNFTGFQGNAKLPDSLFSVPSDK